MPRTLARLYHTSTRGPGLEGPRSEPRSVPPCSSCCPAVRWAPRPAPPRHLGGGRVHSRLAVPVQGLCPCRRLSAVVLDCGVFPLCSRGSRRSPWWGLAPLSQEPWAPAVTSPCPEEGPLAASGPGLCSGCPFLHRMAPLASGMTAACQPRSKNERPLPGPRCRSPPLTLPLLGEGGRALPPEARGLRPSRGGMRGHRSCRPPRSVCHANAARVHPGTRSALVASHVESGYPHRDVASLSVVAGGDPVGLPPPVTLAGGLTAGGSDGAGTPPGVGVPRA